MRILRFVSITILLCAMLTGATTFGQDANQAGARVYRLDVRFFSLIPDQGIDSYRVYSSGGATGNDMTLGDFADDERHINVTVKARKSSNNFVATVSIEPRKPDTQTKEMERTLDLSDLQPQTLEVARTEEGRVYKLVLIPGVRIPRKPEYPTLNVKDLWLDHWSFQDSEIILNDQDYLGRMAASHGELGNIDIPGLAMAEFSLIPFRGSTPTGVYENGVVRFARENGTSLRITNVMTGTHREKLKGGPYRVFVRWKEPSMTVKEYHQKLDELITQMKQQIEKGEVAADNPVALRALEQWERARKSDRVLMISWGLGPISKDDRLR